MSALDNVDTRGDGAVSPCAGFASSSIPKAEGSETGVSVRYAYDPAKRWYALRATYGRAEQAYQYIVDDEADSDAYLAMHFVRKRTKDQCKRVKVPLLPSILFVYCTKEQLKTYVKDSPRIGFVRYYYDRCEKMPGEVNPPLEIGYPQMMNFIRLTSVDDDHIMLVDEKFVHYESGDMVMVTEGKFAGVTGRVARAAGQQRLIVNLEGVALVATAYIPTACLEKL